MARPVRQPELLEAAGDPGDEGGAAEEEHEFKPKEQKKLSARDIEDRVRRNAEDAPRQRKNWMEQQLKKVQQEVLCTTTKKLSAEEVAASNRRMYSEAMDNSKAALQEVGRKYPPGGNKRDRWGGRKLTKEELDAQALRMKEGGKPEASELLPAFMRK